MRVGVGQTAEIGTPIAYATRDSGSFDIRAASRRPES